MATIDVLDAAGDTQTIAKIPATGQAAMADSLPVVIASDQSDVPVTVASSALPTGASTEATLADVLTAANAIAADPATATLQGTIATAIAALNTLLTSLDGKTTAVDTGAVVVASSALPTGAAAEATLAAASAKLPATLGPKAGASSLSVVEATPTVTNITVQTSATGASFVAFASQACNVVRIVNAWPAAVDIEVRRGGAGVTIPVPGGAERAFDGVTNASDLQVRRIDQSNTQVTIYCEAVVL